MGARPSGDGVIEVGFRPRLIRTVSILAMLVLVALTGAAAVVAALYLFVIASDFRVLGAVFTAAFAAIMFRSLAALVELIRTGVSVIPTIARERVSATSAGIELDTRGHDHYAWSDIDRFELAVAYEGECGWEVNAIMHLHEGRTVALPALERTCLWRSYPTKQEAAVRERVALLNNLLEERPTVA